MTRLPPFATPFAISLLFMRSIAFAQSAPVSLSDLPTSHPAYNAVQYLAERGILKGYSDGTFKPDKKVSRAEAMKIIVGSVVQGQTWTPGTSEFSDIPAGAWYEPYVTHAWKQLGVIDGPPRHHGLPW